MSLTLTPHPNPSALHSPPQPPPLASSIVCPRGCGCTRRSWGLTGHSGGHAAVPRPSVVLASTQCYVLTGSRYLLLRNLTQLFPGLPWTSTGADAWRHVKTLLTCLVGSSGGSGCCCLSPCWRITLFLPIARLQARKPEWSWTESSRPGLCGKYFCDIFSIFAASLSL